MRSVQNYKNISMNWKIVSKPINSSIDSLHEYIVYVQDDVENNISAEIAIGKLNKKEIINKLLERYKNYISHIKHED